MPKDIEPKLKLISDYLSSKELFVIPEYQRKYSWTVLQCDKLWQDIESFINASEQEPYFFGTVIADCADSGTIRLIDGQQRTTTFILLLKALLLRMNEKLQKMDNSEDTRNLRNGIEGRRNKILDILYKTNDDTRLDIMEDWSMVKGISILNSTSINELEEYKQDLQVIIEAPDFATAEASCYKIPRRQKDNKYTNFFRNFKFFYLKFGVYDSTQINIFARTFLSNCQVIEIRSWNTEQAITMFNSLNSTGMPLSDADIISAQLYSNSRDIKEAFVAKWEEITKLTDSLSSRKIADLTSIFQQYMYIRRAERKEYIHDGVQPDVTTPGLRRYFTIDNKELLKNPMELCEKILKISRIWEYIADYPIIKLLLKFNENAKLYLISFLNRYETNELSEQKVIGIAECLLKLFTVLEIVDAGYSSARFKTFLFGVNVKLVDKDIQIEDICSVFNQHIVKSWKPEDLRIPLLEYDKNILVFLNEYLFAKKHNLSSTFQIQLILSISCLLVDIISIPFVKMPVLSLAKNLQLLSTSLATRFCLKRTSTNRLETNGLEQKSRIRSKPRKVIRTVHTALPVLLQNIHLIHGRKMIS